MYREHKHGSSNSSLAGAFRSAKKCRANNKCTENGSGSTGLGGREELVSPAMVEKAVRRLMDSAEGEEIRKRAAELGDAVKQSVMEGGAIREEMDSFIAHITRQIFPSQI
ncbi:unnamed protein product [Fraxinus pennsylvanica]|uniref:Uncharacterized protein n=1 Tax=Fraxinus pennsylvanica TaxID=56036 RepID=A0AAD2ALJ3_9LAMI|nr:unnamed protein product [Fraxinus pennsylvanica]